MSQDPKQAALAKIKRWLGAKTELLETLLGSKAMAKRFCQTYLMAITNNLYLLTCDQTSLFLAALYCAQRGLEVGVPDGAALVPFKGKVTAVVQYRALVKQAEEFDQVKVAAYLVYENDEFDYELGLNPDIKHKPAKLGSDRGRVIGGYAVFNFPDGSKKFSAPMDAAKIFKRRDSSAAWQDVDKRAKTPWALWEEEMMLKTVAKDGFRFVPTGPKVRDLLMADSRLEGGASLEEVLDIDLLSEGSIDEPQQGQKQISKVDQMAKAAQERLAAAQKVGEGEGTKEEATGEGAAVTEGRGDPAAAAVAAGAAEVAQDPDARIAALKPRVETAGLQDNLFATFKVTSWDDLKTAPEKLFAMEKFVEAAEKQKKRGAE